MRSAAGGPHAVLTGPCQPHPESSPSACWALLAGLWAQLGPGLGQVAPLHCSASEGVLITLRTFLISFIFFSFILRTHQVRRIVVFFFHQYSF